MKKKNFKNIYQKIGFFSFFLILIDQLTKLYFINKSFLFDFFIYFSYSKNTGSAFSIFSNVFYYNFVIIILSIIILFLLIYNIKYFLNNSYYLFSFIFLISGILGNLIDRIIFGYVNDFIVLKGFFIFNFADIYLNLAFIIFISYEFKINKILKKSKN